MAFLQRLVEFAQITGLLARQAHQGVGLRRTEFGRAPALVAAEQTAQALALPRVRPVVHTLEGRAEARGSALRGEAQIEQQQPQGAAPAISERVMDRQFGERLTLDLIQLQVLLHGCPSADGGHAFNGSMAIL